MAQLTVAALYLTTPGSALVRRRGTLALCAEGVEQPLGPLPHLDRVVVLGRVSITPPALDLLLGRGIPVALCTVRGRLKGVIRPPVTGHTRTRLAQAFALAAPGVALRQARTTVFRQVAAQRVLLAERQRRQPVEALKPLLRSLVAISARVQTAPTLDALRGHEGAATAAYFRCLAAHATGDIRFPGTRSRRPPRDPFNAVLSLLYSLLVAEAADVLTTAGLDPALGFLHTLYPGRPSLACDLVEPFRSMAVDRLVLKLFNHRELGAADFTATDRQGVRLTPEALRRVLALWEAHLAAPCPSYVAAVLSADRAEEVPPVAAVTLRVLLHRHAADVARSLRAAIPLDHLLNLE